MINVTHIIPCHLPKATADAFNRESARIYNNVLTTHWRILRKKGIWLSPYSAERLEDALGGNTFLHAHSRDAAQQAFYKANKTIKGLRNAGHPKAFYPYKRKYFRTTIWKNTGIRLVDNTLLLSCARGLSPLEVKISKNLRGYQAHQFKEVRLFWNRASKTYEWHIIIKKDYRPPQQLGDKLVAISLGDTHPAIITDGEVAVVFSARELHAIRHYTEQRLAELEAIQKTKKPRSNRWNRLEARKTQFLGKQQRQIKDIYHKISHAIVEWSLNHNANKLIIGNGDYVKGGTPSYTRLPTDLKPLYDTQLFKLIKYKAQRDKLKVEWVYKKHAGEVCPECQQIYTPPQIPYQCPHCEFEGAYPVLSAANFLSMALYNEAGKIYPDIVHYRHPFLTGKP